MPAIKTPGRALKEVLPTLSMLAAGVISTLVLVTLPVLVAGMIGQFHWGDKEVGWLASADMAGSAIASLCAITFISRISWRATAYRAIVLVIVGNLSSIYADEFISLLTVRMITGFGNGLILSIAYVGLCHSQSPDRFFGVYTFAQLALQALSLAILPTVLDAHGMPAIYLILAAASGISGLLVSSFPANMLQRTGIDGGMAHRQHGPASHQTSSHLRWSPPPGVSPHVQWIALALAAQAIYFLAPAAVWGYFERIGAGFSLSVAQVGSALGIASVAGMTGAVLVIIMGARNSRMSLMAMGTTISVAAMVLLMGGSGFQRYLIAACLFNFAWNFTFPYQMGVLSLFDQSGSVAILSLVIQLFGLAFGPLLASFLLFGEGYNLILWSCIGCYLTSFIMFGVSVKAPAALEAQADRTA